MNDNDPSNNADTPPSTISVDPFKGDREPAPEVPQPEKTEKPKKGFFASLKSVLTFGSYSVYLVTAWILGIFGIILDSYLMLFLRDFIIAYMPQVELVYITIGFAVLAFIGIELIARFFGGYLGDNVNRKWLSVLTMFISGLGMMILAFATGLIGLIAGILIMSGSSLFASGSTSYIYEQIEPEHSGLAMGIFQTSSGFGLIGLGLVTWLLEIGVPFVFTIQIVFFIGAMCYMVAATIRAVFLAEPRPIVREKQEKNHAREFLKQNANALKLLWMILPVFMVVLILDALSDGFYRFVSTFYLNEALGFSIGEISIMLIVVLAFSIPLSVWVGSFFDKYGSRRAIIAVYSVMPITLALLILAPLFPFWLPPATVASIITTHPILEPLMSTAFIALAMKNINDILWWTLILTYLRKAMPRSETAKMLSIFFIVVFFAFLITPIPSGFIYTFFGAIPLLVLTLCINLVILGILVFANVEPQPIPEEYKDM
ncbi:MAG: MFS transporter [Promethearchaeota archaeon]